MQFYWTRNFVGQEILFDKKFYWARNFIRQEIFFEQFWLKIKSPFWPKKKNQPKILNPTSTSKPFTQNNFHSEKSPS